jgi:ankyrin repeat protein
MLCRDLGDQAKAREYFGRAHAIWERAYGPEHQMTRRIRADLDGVQADLKFPLHAAAKRGDVDAMVRLLDDGAEIDKTEVDRVDKWGNTPLFVACEGGHVDAARLLLDKGAEVDRASTWRKMEGVTSLMVATFGNHVDLMRVLLERGANLELATEYGSTALLVACACGRVDAARLLLERGADVTRAETSGPGRGMDALALAKHSKRAAVVALLEERQK